jgi:nitrogen regulatory protein P-II 2
MKVVTALIRPFKLDDVRQALVDLGHVATISDVKALTPRHEFAPGTPHAMEANKFYAKVRVDVLIPAEETDAVVALLRSAALTGRLGEGDGIIIVAPIDHVLRIRTGATDEEAL